MVETQKYDIALPPLYVLLNSLISQLNSIYPREEVNGSRGAVQHRCHADLSNVCGCTMYTGVSDMFSSPENIL